MAGVYRIGVCGLAHVHYPSLMRTFQELPNAQLIAAADERADARQHVTDEFGVRTYETWDELLAKEEIDCVLCCAENARHHEVVTTAAQRGLPVLVEKPMAATYEQARIMSEVAQCANVLLMINYPSTWNPVIQTMAQLIADGAIGRIFAFRFRAGHRGPLPRLSKEEQGRTWWYKRALGGGALLDFCCYGANISRWFIGSAPEAVTGIIGMYDEPPGDVEDNAVLIIRYADAYALCEASWSQWGAVGSGGPFVWGTHGTLAPLATESEKPAVLLIDEKHPDGYVVPVVEPAPGYRNAPEHFLHCLETGEPLHSAVTPELNLDVSATLEAGARSAISGREVKLSEVTGASMPPTSSS